MEFVTLLFIVSNFNLNKNLCWQALQVITADVRVLVLAALFCEDDHPSLLRCKTTTRINAKQIKLQRSC